MASKWDPLDNTQKNVTPAPQYLSRIKKDLMLIYTDPPPGIYVVPDKNDFTILHALIIGPSGTPYEGGFFYFFIRCPPDYPIRPPQVKLMTTGAGTVRFNPNLYSSGKVCLSILGTWAGPSWSAAQTLSTALVSIQSLMNEKPYHNEPGHEKERIPGAADKYNEVIQHETIRVAVCGMVANESHLNIPPPLVEVIEKKFVECYDFYLNTVEKKMGLNGQQMHDPFHANKGVFEYGKLKEKLQGLHSKYASAKETTSSV